MFIFFHDAPTKLFHVSFNLITQPFSIQRRGKDMGRDGITRLDEMLMFWEKQRENSAILIYIPAFNLEQQTMTYKTIIYSDLLFPYW